MTEFESAVLAYQTATLASRSVGHWIAGASVAVGIGQIAVVAWGIHVMRRAGERRAKEHDDRHRESMTALHELIARTGRARAG